MKWQFEFEDCPKNPIYPIKAIQEMDNGVKKGPVYLKITDLIEAMSTTPEGIHDADALRKLETLVTPSLPYGAIRYSANEEQTRERITMEIPKKQWDIRYGENLMFYVARTSRTAPSCTT